MWWFSSDMSIGAWAEDSSLLSLFLLSTESELADDNTASDKASPAIIASLICDLTSWITVQLGIQYLGLWVTEWSSFVSAFLSCSSWSLFTSMLNEGSLSSSYSSLLPKELLSILSFLTIRCTVFSTAGSNFWLSCQSSICHLSIIHQSYVHLPSVISLSSICLSSVCHPSLSDQSVIHLSYIYHPSVYHQSLINLSSICHMLYMAIGQNSL